MASITTEARNELTGLFIALFNAAPGADHLSSIVAAREAGASLESIAANLAAKPEFQQAYPAFLTAQEFAARVVENLLTNDTVAGAKTWATNWIVGKLNAGETPANVLLQAAQALMLTENSNYASAQDLMLNRIEVANYYSVTQGQPSTNLVDLQTVLDGVTADPASVDSAKAAIDGTLAGETFVLTKGADSFTGTAGADKFIAQSIEEVFTAFDELDGGKGVDTLTIYTAAGVNDGFPANAVVKNIEIININNEGAANYGAVDASVFQGATLINQNAFAAAVTKLGASTVAGFNDIEAGALSVTAAASAASASVALKVDDATTLAVAGDKLSTVTVSGKVTDGADAGSAVDAIALNITVGKDVQALTVNSAVDANLTVVANGKNVTSIDASASAGSIIFTGAATAVTTIKTGAGADEVELNTKFTTTSKAASVSTGAGNDQIVVDLDANGVAGVTASVDAGEGNDEIYLTNIIDVAVNVQAGAGDDKVFLAAIDSVTEDDVINGGEGFDTIVADGKTLVAEDYILLDEVIVGFEAIEFVNTGASIDASRMAAYKNITFSGAASTATKVAADQLISTSVDLDITANGYVAPAGATPATFAGTLNVTTTEGSVGLTAQAEVLNLTVVAEANNDNVADWSEAYLSGDVKVANVVLQSANDTAGTADTSDDLTDIAYFDVSVGSAVGALNKLTTLTITGKGVAEIYNADGTSLTTIDLSGLETVEGYETWYDTDSTKAETIKLGSGQSHLHIEYSTVKNTDTIHNFKLVDDAALAGKQVDWTKSDTLHIDDATGAFAKTTITAGSLNLALVAAAASTDGDNLVFQFSGNTYIYQDSNGDNLLDDSDLLIKLVGLVDLDLLVDAL